MEVEHTFARDEVYPSWFVNALQKFVGLGAFGFAVTKQDNTHIQVVAAADAGAAVVAVQGRWRWIEATITRAHPGGAAGAFDVFVTAAEDVIVSTPAPYTDTTDRSFALAIESSGSTPTIVAGTVDIFRKVATLQWDGSKITSITQLVPTVAPHAPTHASSGSDPLAPADIGAAAAADLATEVTNRAAAVASEAATRAAAVSGEASSRQAGDTLEFVHVAVWDSTSTPTQAAGVIVGEVGTPCASGQTVMLVGVFIKCSGGSGSKFDIQTDHGSSGGVLSSINGLTGLTPATGRFQEVDAAFGGTANTPQPLVRGDSVAVVVNTQGASTGLKVELIYRRTVP